MGTKAKKQTDVQVPTTSTIIVPSVKIGVINLVVTGTSGLITHAWSEKAKRQMREKQQQKAKLPKEAKDPKADFEAAKYLDEKGRDCVPAIGFKNAIASAAALCDMHQTVVRKTIFVTGPEKEDLVPLKFKKCVMREDMVRVGGMSKTADIRYRPEYVGWSARLRVEFNAHMLSAEQVVNLVNQAGFAVGICEWRPEKRGQFGRFSVEAA